NERDERVTLNRVSSSTSILREPGGSEAYRGILNDASARAQHYLLAVSNRPAKVSNEAIDNLESLGGPLSEWGEEPERVLELLDEVGSPATVPSMGRRFFGGVIGGALPVTVAAHWLADAWDQNACLFEFSPVGSYLEGVVLAWLLDLFGLPLNCGGGFVTGTQMAGVSALSRVS